MTEALTDRARCVLGNPEEPHAAALGLLVCAGHQEKLRNQLNEIVDTVARIAIRPARSGSPGSGRSGTLPSQRSVLDMESVALAGPQSPAPIGTADGWDEHHPLAVVGSWARMIREERDLTTPDGPATLTTEVGTVLFWLEWCCEQPWIDEMVNEISDSLARVRRADPERVRPGDEGRCPAIGIGDTNTCGGVLRRERGAVPWLVRPDRCERVPVDVHAGAIRCDTCGARWATDREEALVKHMRKNQAADYHREHNRPHTDDGRPMRTADELAVEWKIARPTVAVWAHRAGVKATRGHYDPQAIRRDKVSA